MGRPIVGGMPDSVITHFGSGIVDHGNGAKSEYLTARESRKLAPKFNMVGKRLCLIHNDHGEKTVSILPYRAWWSIFTATRIILCDRNSKPSVVSVGGTTKLLHYELRPGDDPLKHLHESDLLGSTHRVAEGVFRHLSVPGRRLPNGARAAFVYVVRRYGVVYTS